MPLLDHFRPPLYPNRSWESFHSRWANSIADQLNQVLPSRYFAEVQIHLGSQVEADVAEFEHAETIEQSLADGNRGGIATQTWAPPAAAMTIPVVFPDDLEVHVRDERDDARLVAAVELVSPRNKDRPESRSAFAAKTAAYLYRGVGLVTLDVVTGRQFNLHNELIDLLRLDSSFAMPEDALLYAVAYRPVKRGEAYLIDAWPAILRIGDELPVLPLGLRGAQPVPLNLESAYDDACRRSRLSFLIQ
jgi:Protein of unknown function (DUF4058)